MNPPKNPNVTESDYIRSTIEYCAETGFLFRLTNQSWKPKLNRGGYQQIKINRRLYSVHRVAWFLHYGYWPCFLLDHIDGDKQNNRISNLRESSNAMNQQNRKTATTGSKTGLLGVSEGKNRFQARIHVNGKQKTIGWFKTAQQAHEAYINEKRKVHPGCTI